MLSVSTKDYYDEMVNLSIEELEEIKHKCSDKISWLYHEMGTTITKDDRERFNYLNNESINVHNKLNACVILINHKENGVI